VSQLPPGPRNPLQVLHFSRDSRGFFRHNLERYGDPCTLRLPAGTVVLTASPEGIREIFTADPLSFEASPRIVLQPIVGDNSVLMLSGGRHRRERQLLMPPFHGERMKAYGQLIQDITLRHAAALRPGEFLRGQRLTQAISLEVIIQAVFGVQQPERVREYQDVAVAYLESLKPSILLSTLLRRSLFGLGPWAHFQRQVARMDVLLQQELALRNGQGQQGADILSLLLAARDEQGQPLSEAELKDELRTLVFAGHETTALGLAWALYWLHGYPQALERLRQEVASLGPQPSPEALARLPYLSAVCDETLRIHPVAALVSRRTLVPFTLRGHALPPGTGLMVGLTVTHSDPALYPEPHTFRPERFLERKYSPFEYLPFGGGARRCLGSAFALYEMKVVLGSLLGAHRFRLASNRPESIARRGITYGPSRGTELVYEGPLA
jgi:cytochrome P450 family 110